MAADGDLGVAGDEEEGLAVGGVVDAMVDQDKAVDGEVGVALDGKERAAVDEGEKATVDRDDGGDRDGKRVHQRTGRWSPR